MPCQAQYQTGTDIQGGGSGAGVGIDSLQAGLWVPAGAPFVGQALYNLAGSNLGLYVRFVCPRTMTISKISFGVQVAASADDACDVGILSGDGATLLSSSGSTLGKLNVGGSPFVNLQAAVQLVQGQIYYAGFAWGAVGGTPAQVAFARVDGGGFLNSAFGTTPPLPENGYKSGFPISAGLPLLFNVAQVPILALKA